MNNLQDSLVNLRQKYRKIFIEVFEEISDFGNSLKPERVSGDIFDFYEPKTDGYLWQQKVITKFAERLNNEIACSNEQIHNFRQTSSCAGCGTCCRFAISEFSPDELLKKSQNGDKIAAEFIKTFVPYPSIEDAKQVFPEYVQMLENENLSDYYIYHCPKVTKSNRCPDYENRPQICRDFPDNPIAFLPPKCSYAGWKLKSESVSLKLKAEVEIIKFYIEKIKGLQNR